MIRAGKGDVERVVPISDRALGWVDRYLVDGIDITGLTYGDVGTPLLSEFVHEMQIVSGGYNAEYGRSTGGIINIVTRSGTDTLRGSVFGVVTPGFLTARPGLAHHMPTDAQGRGGAWPSPRTWEMALRLLTFADACAADREALGAALTGAIGDGAGIELLTFAEELDLPDPDRVLANPEAFALPERGDRQLAFLTAVVAAVQARPSQWRSS